MMRLYRDPVHGDIMLSELATRLLDTAQFQRLGRIMQLGFAHLVFRGATHTRFAHCVGTYWMSREILRHIRQNHERLGLPLPQSPWWSGSSGPGGEGLSFDALTEVVAIAALLHDITHIPFGHTLEDELQDFYLKHDALESPRLPALLFDGRSEIAQLLMQPWQHVAGLDNGTLRWLIYFVLMYREREGRTFEEVLRAKSAECAAQGKRAAFFEEALGRYRQLSAGGLFQPFMAEVVSGDVAADLLDYTARDVAFTGLRADFDLRLLHYYFITQSAAAGGTLRLALDVQNPRGYARIDIATEIMNLMRLRYTMAERVYYHKNKVAASAMLARGLVGHGVPGDSNPFDDADSVLQPIMGDDEMVRRLIRAEDGVGCNGSAAAGGVFSACQARRLGEMISRRRLYVPAVILTAEAAREMGGVGRFVEYFRGTGGGGDNGKRRLHQLQSELSAIGGIGPHGVLVYCPPQKMQAKAVSVPVRFAGRAGGTVALSDHPEFRDEAELLNRRYQNLWKAFVFVHPELLNRQDALRQVCRRFAERLEIDEQAGRRLPVVGPDGHLPEGQGD